MIKISIDNQSSLISIDQLQWFKTLVNAYQYLHNQSADVPTIELPNQIADQLIDIEQFNQLVESYQQQIALNRIDYSRPRSVLEHYLEGILDDLDGHVKDICEFINCEENHPVDVDLKLWQLICQIADKIDLDQYCPIPRIHNEIFMNMYVNDNRVSRIIWLGSLDIIKHLNYDVRSSDLEYACYYGYADILEYLHIRKSNADNDQLCRIAIITGHFECVKYVHNCGLFCRRKLCTLAADCGHLNILQFLHNNGYPWNKTTCFRAAQNGHLDCLQYAHENGCPWHVDACTYASAGEHFECLKYALEHGCPRDKWTYTSMKANKNPQIREYLESHINLFN